MRMPSFALLCFDNREQEERWVLQGGGAAYCTSTVRSCWVERVLGSGQRVLADRGGGRPIWPPQACATQKEIYPPANHGIFLANGNDPSPRLRFGPFAFDLRLPGSPSPCFLSPAETPGTLETKSPSRHHWQGLELEIFKADCCLSSRRMFKGIIKA
jgi:hypothetical protein